MRIISIVFITLAQGQEDLFSGPKYQLDLKPVSTPNFHTAQFDCYIPPAAPVTSEKLNLSNLVEKLRQMPCLYSILESRYWSFEFCAMKHVIQFNALSQTEKKYLLGVYKKQTSQKLDFEVLDGVKQPLLVQEWGGGTVCDLLQSPRKSKVEYHCGAEERVSVTELSSCYYLLVVYTPRVCIGSTNVNSIRCAVKDTETFSYLPRIEEKVLEDELKKTFKPTKIITIKL